MRRPLDGWTLARVLVPLACLVPFAAGLARGSVFYFRDLSSYFLPIRRFVVEGLRHGEIRHWNPYVNEGAPVVLPPVGYPIDLLQVLLPGDAGISLLLALHVPLAGLTFLALARRLGLRRRGRGAGRSRLRPLRLHALEPQPLRPPRGDRLGPARDRDAAASGVRRRPRDRIRRGGDQRLPVDHRVGDRRPGRGLRIPALASAEGERAAAVRLERPARRGDRRVAAHRTADAGLREPARRRLQRRRVPGSLDPPRRSAAGPGRRDLRRPDRGGARLLGRAFFERRVPLLHEPLPGWRRARLRRGRSSRKAAAQDAAPGPARPGSRGRARALGTPRPRAGARARSRQVPLPREGLLHRRGVDHAACELRGGAPARLAPAVAATAARDRPARSRAPGFRGRDCRAALASGSSPIHTRGS